MVDFANHADCLGGDGVMRDSTGLRKETLGYKRTNTRDG